MLKIGLSNIETHGHHGVFKEEQEKGNLFYTDVMVWYDNESSIKTDELEDTFDYQILLDVVQEEMEKPSKLIEHLAGRMINAIANKDTYIKKVFVKIAKLNPPVNGKAERSIVELIKDVNKTL